ncbi:MAG TPA: TOBE domain-containing protein [Candidatus Eremiobacteraceae bacterium]|nr:TOBE domain-containing protein [Candidatus Eremiobacteraceae bacterium]
MQSSARNKLPGIIQDVEVNGLIAKVSVRVGDNHVVAIITAESVAELELEVGDAVTVMIKATSVMLAK